MSTTVKLSDKIVRASTIFAEENGVSPSEQVERWTTIGLEQERAEKGPLTFEEREARFSIQVGDEPSSSIMEEHFARGMPVVGGLDDDDPTVYIAFPCGAVEEYAEHKLAPSYVPS